MILAKTLQRTGRQVGPRSAFTLLEVLVVVAILIVLAGAAVVYVPQYLEDSRVKRAQLDCAAWEKAALSYYTNNNSTWPNSLEDCVKYMDGGQSKLVDPWNNPYTGQPDVVNEQEVFVVSCTSPKQGRITKNTVQNPN